MGFMIGPPYRLRVDWSVGVLECWSVGVAGVGLKDLRNWRTTLAKYDGRWQKPVRRQPQASWLCDSFTHHSITPSLHRSIARRSRRTTGNACNGLRPRQYSPATARVNPDAHAEASLQLPPEGLSIYSASRM